MTRLTRSHLDDTREQLERIDDMLRRRVGADLRSVALRVIGLADDANVGDPPARVAVIPITAGEGTIPGFSDTLCAIARHIGLEARATVPDVGGIAEAWIGGDDLALLADDSRFIAINTSSGKVADNDRTTGEGFAALLAMMAGGVAGRPCGVVGCGPVGSHAALRLAREGAGVTVCDTDEVRGRHLAARVKERVGSKAIWTGSVSEVLDQCLFVVDATPAAGIISSDMLRRDTVITAPGVPMGVTPEAMARLGARFYNDNLPLGVAVMLMAALFGRMVETKSI